MRAFEWRGGASGFLTIEGKRLKTVCHGPAPYAANTIVMLHEGLGCVALWRDFPEQLAAATGLGVFAYSRAGYGQSDPVKLPRPLDYMTREARETVPEVLEAIGSGAAFCLGHSDGASIAAIYAGTVEDFRVRGLMLIAPHFFTEESGLAAITRRAKRTRSGSQAQARQISSQRRQCVPRLERRLARSRLQVLEHRRDHRLLAHPGPRHSRR